MNTPDHTPACAESPHFCICSTSRPGSTTAAGEKPKIMESLNRHPGILTMDDLAVDPDTANLFKEPGSLVADGSWSLRQHHLTKADLPEIRVKRGGLKWPTAEERLELVRTKLTAERDTAQEQVRFWRRQSAFLGVLTLGWMGSTIAYALGWI